MRVLTSTLTSYYGFNFCKEAGLLPRFPRAHAIIDDLYTNKDKLYGYKGHQLLRARGGEPGYEASSVILQYRGRGMLQPHTRMPHDSFA